MGLPQLDGDGGTHKNKKRKRRRNGGGGDGGGGGNNRPGPLHRRGSLPRTPAQALRQAQAQSRNATKNWNGLCANFVASMYGAVGLGGYSSAVDQWANIPDRLKHGGTNAPRGALVFWGGGYGHVAISAGGGYVWTTDFDGAGKVSLVKASDITSQWGKPVSGWSQPYWGGHTVKIKGGAGDPPPEARYAGGGMAGGGGGSNSGFQRDKLSNKELAEQWGWAASFLKSDPELKKLFQRGTNQGWSQQRFISELRDTRWFQNHSSDWRQAEYLRKTDPSSYRANVREIQAQINDLASEMGARLTKHELDNLAERVYQFGLNDAQIRNILAEEVQRKNGSFLGEAGAVEDSLNQYAAAMGVRVGNEFVKNAVRGMSSGNWSEQQIQDRIKKMAMSSFPSFRDEIEEGQTMQDIAAPYMQSMSAILEMNPAEVDLFKPKIRQALTARDKDGKPSPATLWDFETSLRQDNRWLSTKNGTEALAAAGSKVLQDFGFEAAF